MLRACDSCYDGNSLRWMGEKILFGVFIGYSDSYLEFFLLQSLPITCNTTLCYWSSAATYWQRLGFKYLFVKSTNPCLLRHVTVLLLSFCGKFSLPCSFNKVSFWSGVPCVVLDDEIAKNKQFRSWEIWLLGMFRNFRFVPQGSTNSDSKQFEVQESYTNLSRTVEVWTTVSFKKLLLKL